MKETIKIMTDKTVESSLGWRVKILSADSLQYQEQGKTISFKIEDYPDETGELEWIIYVPTKCEWQDSNNEEVINQEKLNEIINRISLSFWKLDMKIKKIA
ncbi:MAG: hypothetical protein WC373_09605 [Smithella sp.]|jgi:hypothetical protein